MVENRSQLNSLYEQQGYFVVRNYFTSAEVSSLSEVVLKFHTLWKKDHENFYR